MGCNCGGRSGGRATRTGTTGTVWRHIDQHGGQVDYASEASARIAQRARGGTVDQIDPRTGATITPTTREES
ncbi:hypothetical protein [Streptomyces boncukensis]|uniref:Uncharacterized protein n=1 Tax=Streptomyces boncukensis TaxID=2711219 RepID=A0A6G4WYY5_9ACTN|nr:hypothetical protein [Streptomyces boncukensis]NGO70506.1 hypothetical protein [Streptomyces boncukensis]